MCRHSRVRCSVRTGANTNLHHLRSRNRNQKRLSPQSRRPEPVIEPPDFRLVGISVSGQQARALVVSGSSPDPQWIAEGESIGRWTLVRVGEDGISVEQSGKKSCWSCIRAIQPVAKDAQVGQQSRRICTGIGVVVFACRRCRDHAIRSLLRELISCGVRPT